MKSLQKNQSTDLQLRQRSTGLIATLIDAESSRQFERALTIKQIVNESLPIVELRRHVEPRQISQALDIQLTRLVASMNIQNTMNDYQIKTLVEDLLDRYPNESLEDFILCFKKGRTGELGKTFNRLDSEIIFEWMAVYLDEKYQVLEDELMKWKENPHSIPEPVEGPGYQAFKKWAKELSENKVVRPITDEDMRREGQRIPVKKPAATGGYAYFEVRGIKLMATSQLHAEELVQLMIERGELEE